MLNLYGIPANTKRENLTLSAKSLGTLGELTIASALQKSGLTVKVQPGRHLGDLLVSTLSSDNLKIEVKTSFRSKRGNFKFSLYRKMANGGRLCADHTHADLLVLICVEDDLSVVAFTLPTSAVTAHTIEFKNPLFCKYRQYISWQ